MTPESIKGKNPEPAKGEASDSSNAKSYEEIRDKVIDIVCEKMGVPLEKVKPETSFINDLGADSLDTVELIMEFEDAFDLNIPDEVAEKIQTIGDAIKYVVEHPKNK